MPILIFLIAFTIAFFSADGVGRNLPSSSGQSSALNASVNGARAGSEKGTAAKKPASTKAGTSDEAAALAVKNVLEPSVGAALESMGVPSGESPVCSILKQYPKPAGEPLSFEKGEVSGLCRPFVSKDRRGLDHCGDSGSDPYSSSMTSESVSRSSSRFTWASRNEMYKRGKVNIVTDPAFQSALQTLLGRAEEIRGQASELCCGDDLSCQQAMAGVEISVCQPASDPNAPDPCVFGGYYQMAGAGYTSMYKAIYRQSSGPEAEEMRKTAARNLSSAEIERIKAEPIQAVTMPFQPVSGKIVLSSYVSKTDGVRSIEPTLHHEFGHACSMIKMQKAAVLSGGTPENTPKAARAVQWIDKVKDRCSSNLELPEAYYDFWESIGESRELASCLYRLTEANQKQKIDRTCEKLCPGHYLEESVGIAFSLLNGDLSGLEGSVFPNTCDHVRDGQHPMVSDVVDCLAQHSPRFRNRLRQTYRCGN